MVRINEDIIDALSAPYVEYMKYRSLLCKKIVYEKSDAFLYDDSCPEFALNVYIDLDGVLKPRKNPSPGLYYFDGQVFYRKRVAR